MESWFQNISKNEMNLIKRKFNSMPKPFISYIVLLIKMNLIMFDNVSWLKFFGDY